MTQDEKRIAIAEALGFSFEDKEIMYDGMPIKFRIWRNATGESMGKQGPPDWFSDLNAMHEALSTLGPADFEKYRWVLWGRVKQVQVPEWQRAYLQASAAIQAECFLVALNLWKP